MRLIILCLLLTCKISAQNVDSTYYEKVDSNWYEVTLKKTIVTKVDTLVRNKLMNEIHDISLQLYHLREQLKVKEKEVYSIFKRNNRQLKKFNRVQDMPRDTIKGQWLLDGTQVTIRNDKIGNNKLTWYSTVSFEYQNQLYIKQDLDLWVSDKSKFEKVKTKSIK